MSRTVHLAIDTLILDGAAAADRAGFERALRDHIAQALAGASNETLAGIASSQRLDAGRLADPANPAAVGERIASRLIGGGA